MMRFHWTALLFALAVVTIPGSSQVTETTPRDKIGFASPIASISGWQVPSGIDRHNYEISRDTSVRHQGLASAYLRSKVPNPTGPNNTFLRQVVGVTDYLNKRVRFSVYAKTENVEYVNFWMQMAGEGGLVMNDDRMANRPLTGSLDWRRYDLVLDVPQGTHQIVLGISLKGRGHLWVDDLRFEEVGNDVPTTGIKSPAEIQAGSAAFIEQYKAANPDAYANQVAGAPAYIKRLPRAPLNLDFEN